MLSTPSMRAAIIGAVTVLLLLFGGCSALRFGYGQADAFAFRWLDSYADFDAVQARRVRQAIDAWFQWNRRTQLADYAALLDRLDEAVGADTTPEQVCAWWDEARRHLDRGLEQAAPAIADIAVTLRPAQIDNVEQRYAKGNREFRDDFLQADPVRRQREAAKRAIARAEWLYGDLDRAQSERVRTALARTSFDPQLALEERRRRQQDSLQVLRRLASGAVNADVAQAEVRALVQRFEHSPREAARRHAEQLVGDNCRLAAEIHNGTTPAQRAAASRRLRGWAGDLRALAAESG
jgi:hypothetical protein